VPGVGVIVDVTVCIVSVSGLMHAVTLTLATLVNSESLVVKPNKLYFMNLTVVSGVLT